MINEIFFEKRDFNLSHYTGYIIIHNGNIEFTGITEEPIGIAKAFAHKYKLNTSDTISNCLRLLYRTSENIMYITADRRSDLVKFATKRNDYFKLIKDNLQKSYLTNLLQI